MKYVKNNNRGFSLVEVVASLVIISIILISFFQFFTSNTKVAAHNTNKLVTINLADATLAKLKSFTLTSNTVEDADLIELGINPTELNTTERKLYSYFIDDSDVNPTEMIPPRAIELNGKLYTIDYKPTQNNDKVNNSNFSESSLNFIRVEVFVYSPDGKTKGKSEGYVQID